MDDIGSSLDRVEREQRATQEMRSVIAKCDCSTVVEPTYCNCMDQAWE